MPLVQRRLRDTDGARGGLDAGAFEGLHELLEALPSSPPRRFSPFTLKSSKLTVYSFMPR
jgi:hypothetical protein